MKREIWDIIASELNGELTDPAEKLFFEQWLKERDNHSLFKEAKDVYQKTGLFYSLKGIDTEKAWKNVDQQLGSNKNVRFIFSTKKIIWAAAVIAFFLVTSFSVWLLKPTASKNYEFITQETDLSRPAIQLNDGTKVTLNHGSKLIYPAKFSGKSREVKLVGQAFFEVAPNKEIPFIISTKGAYVKVVGTSFEVMAYENSETTEVRVATGQVELYNENTLADVCSRVVVLFPGEMGSFNRETGEVGKMRNYSPNNLSWYTRNLQFDDTPLSEVIETLEKSFDINIVVANGVDLNGTLSAKFVQQDVGYILNVISMTLGLSIDPSGGKEYVVKNK